MEKTDQELMSELISLAANQRLPIGEDVWLIPYLNTYTKYEGQDFLRSISLYFDQGWFGISAAEG